MLNYRGLLRRVLHIYYGAGATEGIFHSTHTQHPAVVLSSEPRCVEPLVCCAAVEKYEM